MIEIVKSPSSKTFYKLIGESKSQLLLCAPYIKKEVVSEILKLKKDGTTLSVITSAKAANFASGSSDVEAIEMLIDNGISVINYQRLHAKIYLFDNKKALITSANLTNHALFHNYEYGVLVHEDEKETIDKVYSDFVEMMESELHGEFNKTTIARIKKYVEAYKGFTLVKIDEDEDELLPIDETIKLEDHLNKWEKDVFDCLELIKAPTFKLTDVYKFVPVLQAKHPENHHVEAKIRQMLQNLRDLGFVKFVKPGEYKKLWICAPIFTEKAYSRVEA